MAEQGKQNIWLVPVVVVGLLALIGILAVVTKPSGDTPVAEPAATAPADPTAAPSAPAQATTPEQVDGTMFEVRDEADVLGFGDVNAPVGMVVFSDYQCKFCAQWTVRTMPLMWEYVESGELRMEWRDINIFGDPSARGAHAVFAAAKQDAFYEYHHALFADGEPAGESDLTDDALLGLAGELGLDTEQFAADYASQEAADAVAASEELGQVTGAASTPSFILGGVPIQGAQPTEVFIQTMEEALARSQN